MTLADLTSEEFKAVERLAVDYLQRVAIARARSRANPEGVASPPKIEAYRLLIRAKFTPDQAVEAFREMCGIVDGVTA